MWVGFDLLRGLEPGPNPAQRAERVLTRALAILLLSLAAFFLLNFAALLSLSLSK
jgi:hypothetical protein